MAYTDSMTTVSFEAGADLSDNQYFFVKTSGGKVVAADDGGHAVGVLQNYPDAAGKAAEVAISGKVKVSCGGDVTQDGPVASDANGKCVDAASGDVILGTALESGSDGATITILFHPRGEL